MIFSAQPINHHEQRRENICQCMNNSFERFICPTICTDHSSQRKLTRPSLHDPCALQKVLQKSLECSKESAVGWIVDCDLWHAALQGPGVQQEVVCIMPCSSCSGHRHLEAVKGFIWTLFATGFYHPIFGKRLKLNKYRLCRKIFFCIFLWSCSIFGKFSLSSL